jgi:hypothetical protein
VKEYHAKKLRGKLSNRAEKATMILECLYMLGSLGLEALVIDIR